MEINQDSTDKYILNMMENFRNPDHKKDTTAYLQIRTTIDKVKKYTIRNDVQSLLALDKYAGDKTFKDLTQDDIISFEGYLQKEHVSERISNKFTKKKGLEQTSIDQYMCHIKRFYKYLFNKEDYKKGKRFQKNISYPDNVVWISVNTGNSKELPIEKILSEEDLLKLLNVCDNLRDQAMFGAGFYDAGLRISELISLNIRNVSFDRLGAKFILPKKGTDLKTGQRVIRLFLMPSSTNYLKKYLDQHPLKQYDNAPLFLSNDSRVYSKVIEEANNKKISDNDFDRIRLSRPGIEYVLDRCCRMAGIQRLTPHMLRHNSVTQCVKKGFNEMELRIRYGWASRSKMPSTYTHLASEDLDSKIKVITGYEEPEQLEPSKLVSIGCWNCNEENVPTARYCSKCGMLLKRTKEDLLTANDIGVAMQQMLDTDNKEKALETLEKLILLLKKTN